MNTGPGVLSLLTFLPLLGALLIIFVPERFPKVTKVLAVSTSIAAFAISLQILADFQSDTFHLQMVERMNWLPSLGISYSLGVDGLSIWLVMLTTFLTVISALFSLYVDHRVKAYFASLLVLETAMLGVFLSLDLILFYTFFEASLVPMFFLISIWGGEKRAYASVKFFIYTFSASVFMLIGMVAVALLYREATGQISFNMMDLQAASASGALWQGAIQAQALLFWAFAIAFMVKCPLFPFHTWLPDAHTEAPTAGSILLAGVLLKMGTYGFLRVSLPLFPEATQSSAVVMVVLGVIAIIYGAIVAAVQPDVKKLVAYSSVAHMGFVLVGIFSLTHTGMLGGAIQQLNHGISTGALFLLIGLLYERRHTRLFKDFGGLKAQMPIFAALFLIVMLSSVGLPGTNGFIGEFLALMGLFEASFYGAFGLLPWMAVVAACGVILAAVYCLWMFQKVFYGANENPENRRLRDIKPWEIGLVGALVVFVFWGGLYPNTFFKPMDTALTATRMMVLNPPGQRPRWDDLTNEVDQQGNFVLVQPRERNANLESYIPIRLVYPANLHIQQAPIEASLEGKIGLKEDR